MELPKIVKKEAMLNKNAFYPGKDGYLFSIKGDSMLKSPAYSSLNRSPEPMTKVLRARNNKI